MSCRCLRIFTAAFFALNFWVTVPVARAQGTKQTVSGRPAGDADADHADADHERERNAWFLRGRVIPGKNSAELRRRAYLAKMQNRNAGSAAAGPLTEKKTPSPQQSSVSWQPLGPVPLASDASGNGTQDYHQVSGRATAVAIDPADPSGNTVYIGGAQGGVWQSSNAANSAASSVTWTPVTDDQATLSVGSIAIQPGNTDPTQSVILVSTGEADNSADSYFGLGILRSADGGNSWTLISTANSGALSFSGLGGTRMAFSTASTVVSAMAAASEAVVAGAVTTNTMRGLYTSLDAGQSWTFNALLDPGSRATDATSATSVAYNAAAGIFLAAVRYHGFYSSPDGVTWTRLANQPSGSALSTTFCPPLSTTNKQACPIYRGEITVVPGRNEMYAWFVSLDSSGLPVDGGIWLSLNGGTSWTHISETGITNCGDESGCGVGQGYYNLELLAVPNGSAATDLYAGAINLYKCSISSANPTCASQGFINLTHVYGCTPTAAPSHVHPDQHALAYMIPSGGGDSGNDLMYFANDGGIYRALDGYSGLTAGSCSGTNQFDDLNQNLGSMTQFVSFSQHPSDPNTMLGGTQDNGSPGTSSATTSLSWINVNGGDGGYNAIDPNTPLDWFVSNPDIPPGGLNIQECPNGVNCVEGTFSSVVGSASVGGDDGAFYFPYVLDPQSATALVVGTCRVWRGPRLGGSYTLLSPNFDTLATGTCSGSEINLVRSLAAGGPTDVNGSLVLYATTDGQGPIDGPLSSPVGGNVWVTTNATAGAPAFTQVTQSINPNQFPISSVALDSSDPTGKTAYVTIMGFTGTTGHVWQTTNAGTTWTDFTGTGLTALPDAPVNAVVVDSSAATVYVGTDVGVFESSTASPAWTEVGPAANPLGGSSGFLPNVAVTALGIFNSGGQELLRASTYGRGIWQFGVSTTGDFQLSVSNSTQTVFIGQTATYNGTLYASQGYSNSVTLTCLAGATSPPSTCNPPANPVIPTVAGLPFTVTASGAVGDYSFDLQGIGSDSNLTQNATLVLHVISFGITAPSPGSVSTPDGTTSSPVSFQVTATGSFDQSVTVSCSVAIAGAMCNLTPGTTVSPTAGNPVNMTASVVVPAGTAANSYTVNLQASTSGGGVAPTSFVLIVTAHPDFTLTEPGTFPTVNAGSNFITGPIGVASQDGFNGTVSLTCSLTSGNGSCSVAPNSVSSYPASPSVTINATALGAGSYQASVQGVSGATTHTLAVPFNVGDYQLSGVQSLTLPPGGQTSPGLAITITASTYYSGTLNASCDHSALTGSICTLSPANPVTVSAGAQVLLTATIDVPNDAAAGTYNFKINTQDTSGAPTHSFPIALTVIQDFGISASPSSQTVVAGQATGPYSVVVQPVGTSFSNPVTLSCSGGLPSGALCAFTPNPVPPPIGSGGVDVVMTISTVAPARAPRQAVLHTAFFYMLGLTLPGIVVLWGKTRGRKQCWRWVMTLLVGLVLPLTLLSCAGGTGISTGGCGAVPSVPTGLASSATTSTGTTLNWSPSSVGAGCSINLYTVYENGTSIAGPTGTSFVVTGLLPSTPQVPETYNFEVAASDSAGISSPSGGIPVTTLSAPTYTVTITGVSGSLSHSATVTLIVIP
jgi:hypothetical protein